MTGLAGGRSTIPPNPRPPASGFSPVRKPFRSMPAQNVPPAPVSTITRISVRASRSSSAAAMALATASLTALRAVGRSILTTATVPSTSVSTITRISVRASRSSSAAAMALATASLTALRAVGRSIVTTATGPSTSVSTASGTASPPVCCSALPPDPASLLRLEPDTAVEPDDLGVHVVVLDQRSDEVREFGGRTHPLREHHRCRELGLELLAGRSRSVDRRVDYPRADGVHPDTDGRQVPGGRHRHADDPALGRGVGDLACLSLDASDGRGVDDHAAQAVGVDGLGARDGGGPDPHQVERADQVDVDDLAEGRQVVRGSVAAHGA